MIGFKGEGRVGFPWKEGYDAVLFVSMDFRLWVRIVRVGSSK